MDKAGIAKRQGKIFLIILKYLPMFLLSVEAVRIVLICFYLSAVVSKWLVPAFTTILLVYYLSFIFKYCLLHRLPLYSLAITWVLCNFTTETLFWCGLLLFVTVILIIIYYVTYYKKNFRKNIR